MVEVVAEAVYAVKLIDKFEHDASAKLMNLPNQVLTTQALLHLSFEVLAGRRLRNRVPNTRPVAARQRRRASVFKHRLSSGLTREFVVGRGDTYRVPACD